jgi:YD repeat-containing protein
VSQDTGTWKTPVYTTTQEEYVSGYEIPVYGTVEVTTIVGYDTLVNTTSYGLHWDGTYDTPIYAKIEERYVTGYLVESYETIQTNVIEHYLTPISVGTGLDQPVPDLSFNSEFTAYRTPMYDELGRSPSDIYEGAWNGKKWQYSSDNYTVGQVTEHSFVSDNVSNSGDVNTSRYAYKHHYNEFGQLETETNTSSQSDSSITYTYHENGLLASKVDYDDGGKRSSSKNRRITGEFSYNINGQRTVELYENTDTKNYNNYGGGSLGSNTVSSSETRSSYDSLGRLINVSSPAGSFGTDRGSRDTARVDNLSYHYDEWGNRSEIVSTYKLVDSNDAITKKRAL